MGIHLRSPHSQRLPAMARLRCAHELTEMVLLGDENGEPAPGAGL